MFWQCRNVVDMIKFVVQAGAKIQIINLYGKKPPTADKKYVACKRNKKHN